MPARKMRFVRAADIMTQLGISKAKAYQILWSFKGAGLYRIGGTLMVDEQEYNKWLEGARV